MKETFTKLLEIIDPEWIKENPEMVYTLIEALIKDVRHYRDAMETQREINLLTKAILQKYGELMDEKKREALKTLGRIS